MDDLLTAEELMKRLRVSRASLVTWQRMGMPNRRIGRLVRYDLARVLAWFEEQQAKKAAARESGRVAA